MSERIKEIEARLSALPAGNWSAQYGAREGTQDEFSHTLCTIEPEFYVSSGTPVRQRGKHLCAREVAEFIAHAKQDIEYLLSKVKGEL